MSDKLSRRGLLGAMLGALAGMFGPPSRSPAQPPPAAPPVPCDPAGKTFVCGETHSSTFAYDTPGKLTPCTDPNGPVDRFYFDR